MLYLKLIILQVFWYFAIKSGANVFFPALALLLLITDFFLFFKQPNRQKYLIFSGVLILIGFFLDQSFHSLGAIEWGSQRYPFELLAVWIIFPCYYHDVFTKFMDRPSIAFIIGFIFGPFAYFSGGNINQMISINTTILNLLTLGIGWGSFFFTSVYFFKKYVLRG